MTEAEVDAKVYAVLARTLSVDQSTFDRTTRADDVDGWDSLAHATILIRLEKAFDIDLDRAAANKAPDVGALIDLVGRTLP